MRKRTGYLIKRGKIYFACWYINNRKIVKTTGKTDRREAEAELNRMIAPFTASDEIEVLKGIENRIAAREEELVRIDEAQNPPLAVDQAWAAFEKSPGRPDSGPGTMKQYSSEFKRFKAWLASRHPSVRLLRDVGPNLTDEYAEDLQAAKLTASTFNQHINFLGLLWKTLARPAKIKSNPWDGITRKKIARISHRKRALTADQVTRLLDAANEVDPELKDLLFFLAWTGQRLIDGVTLRRDAVDFRHNVITLYPVKTSRRQGKAVYIPMFPLLKAMLEKRCGTLNSTAAVFPKLAADYRRDPSEVSKRIGRLFDSIGLAKSESRDGLARKVVCYGAHSLRHYFITAASAAGLPAAMIKTITGHATDGMMEHYQHFDAKLAAQFAKKLAEGKASAPAIDDKAQSEEVFLRVREELDATTATNWTMIRDRIRSLLAVDVSALESGAGLGQAPLRDPKALPAKKEASP